MLLLGPVLTAGVAGTAEHPDIRQIVPTPTIRRDRPCRKGIRVNWH
jgi:hypothetical protein